MIPSSPYKAMFVEESDKGVFTRRIVERTIRDLPDGDVLIKVHYSSLNYKDALSAIGNRGVTRRYPHTPGIDAAGNVAESKDGRFAEGDPVLVTGYDLGMNTAGGFGQFIRVPADWVVPLPSPLSLWESMALGTAGFTAGLCVDKIVKGGVTPDSGEILVTGASGGVGSLAVALLAHNGYKVVAATGKPDAAVMLENIGAAKIVGRDAVLDNTGKPLLAQRWAGAVDTVGGDVLSTVIRSTMRHGVVSCCGNVASAELHLTVYPFILRGILLAGADSATSTMETRMRIWNHLSGDWKLNCLDRIADEVALDGLDDRIDAILAGKQTGRCVVRLQD